MNEQLHVPTDRQRAYLRYLLSQAHAAGVPYLPIDDLHRDAVNAWIEYLDVLVQAHWNIQRDLAQLREEAERNPAPYLVIPPRDQLPSSYRPPYDPLPQAEDHEHLVGSVTREDGIEEAVCVLCGVSVDGHDRPIRRVQCEHCGLRAVEWYLYLGTFARGREVTA